MGKMLLLRGVVLILALIYIPAIRREDSTKALIKNNIESPITSLK
jgi:hypothetical protein